MIGYSDSDFAGDMSDRKSVSGCIFMLQNGPITWYSKKQTTVALSTAEAEYTALSFAAREAVWLSHLLTDFDSAPSEPLLIYEDNAAAICMSKNAEYHNRTKHIDVKTHFIRHQVENNVISVKHLSSSEMLADLFTKPLPRERFQCLRTRSGITELTLV